MHAVDRLVFVQLEIILAHGNTENDGCDVLEAVNPFLSFGALPADIDHSKLCIFNFKVDFCDTCCLGAGTENILLVWHEGWVRNSVDTLKPTAKDQH